MVAAIDRKLLRDLWALRGQVVTIALIVGAGIASWVAIRSTWASLLGSRDAYYVEERFGDVFARGSHVPDAIAARLEDIEGVATVYTRISSVVLLPLPTLAEPASAQILSIPDHGAPPLNGLVLTDGGWPDPARGDEAVLLEAFATRYHIVPGDSVPTVVNGSYRSIRVTGIAMSPEFVFASGGELIPTGDRFAVLWMPRSRAEQLLDMEGAFDDVVIALQPGASEAAVIAGVDRVLSPWGGVGAYGRAQQASNYMVNGELSQLESMATVMPFIFLGVAAFLLNVVLGRLVHLQRGQIAALKAVGYGDARIALHYLELVGVIVAAGAVAGVLLGRYLGLGFADLYAEYFHFPRSLYRLDTGTIASGVLAGSLAAVVGAMITMRDVASLPPAEAMRPPAPPRYRPTLLSRSGLAWILPTGGRMVLREIERRPLRFGLSVTGIAMGVAILVLGRFMAGSMEHLVQEVFMHQMREDLAIVFRRPVPERALREIEHLPGVIHAEGMRTSAARMRFGHLRRDVVIQGWRRGDELRLLTDPQGLVARVPDDGIMLTRTLAELLHVRVGDEVSLAMLEGQRRTGQVRVVSLLDEMFGLQGHMSLPALSRLLREERLVSTATLSIEEGHVDRVQAALLRAPIVAGTFQRQRLVDQFREQSGQNMGAMTTMLTLFACIIAIGVVYNNARVALSTRERDLASLRVLGFTRGEISAVLMGELAAQILCAIPLGLWVGTWMAQGVMSTADPERYRMAAVITPATYAYAGLVASAAGLMSALLVRRRLDRLDLIGVLKTRE